MGNTIPNYYTFSSIIENNIYKFNHKGDIINLEQPTNSLADAHLANFQDFYYFVRSFVIYTFIPMFLFCTYNGFGLFYLFWRDVFHLDFLSWMNMYTSR